MRHKIRKLKNWLFNSNQTFNKIEQIINWTIFILTLITVVFGVAFTIFTWDENPSNFTNEFRKHYGYTLKVLGSISFIALMILLTSLLLKWYLKRRRKRHETS